MTHAPWDEPTVRWDDFAAVVVRSPWNYHRKFEAFLEWIDRVEASEAVVLNHPETLRWNADKSYLFDLSGAGVPVIPSSRIENPTGLDPGEIARALGSSDVVVKPLVGAGGDRTFRMKLDGPGAADRFGAAATREPILVQAFLPEIVSRGEWSLIYLGGEYSHAIRKTPADGEFRVHEERGGSLEGGSPPEAVRQVADLVLGTLDATRDGILVRTLDRSPLYARVDLVESESGPLLMELELVEPALYFDFGAGSAERFADALAETLQYEG